MKDKLLSFNKYHSDLREIIDYQRKIIAPVLILFFSMKYLPKRKKIDFGVKIGMKVYQFSSVNLSP